MDIKPCPFCKKNKTKVERKLSKGLRATLSVRCNVCRARGPIYSYDIRETDSEKLEKFTEKAIELWNNR